MAAGGAGAAGGGEEACSESAADERGGKAAGAGGGTDATRDPQQVQQHDGLFWRVAQAAWKKPSPYRAEVEGRWQVSGPG